MISFTRADIPHIPDDVAFAMAPCAGSELSDPGLRSDISLSLFSHLAERMGFGHAHITVEKESSGRPAVSAGDERWGASITHTRGMIACAVKRNGAIGIDMELTDRTEHPALRKRLLSAGDDPDLIDRFGTIQLWTIKEAVLKLYGTGLRIPMKNVILATGTQGQFRYASTDALVEAHVRELNAIVYSGRINAFRIALAWEVS
ncbi:MAG: 4'-phosphopantetheinyl transferase superfamily protein [Cyclonatronaceae bacterium]